MPASDVSVSVPSGDIDDGAATALRPLQMTSSSTPGGRDSPTNDQQAQQQLQRTQPLSRKEKLEHYLAKNAASQRKSLAASSRGSTSSSSSNSSKEKETAVALRQPLRTNAGACDSGGGSSLERPRSASEEYSNYLERLARYQQRKKSFLASSAPSRPGVATETARSLVQEKENDGNRDHISPQATPTAPAPAANSVVGSMSTSSNRQGTPAASQPPTKMTIPAPQAGANAPASTNRLQALGQLDGLRRQHTASHPPATPTAPSQTITPATAADAAAAAASFATTTRMITTSRTSSLLRPTASSYGKQRKETPARLRIQANSNVNPMMISPRLSLRPRSPRPPQRVNLPPTFARATCTPVPPAAGAVTRGWVGEETKGDVGLVTTPGTTNSSTESGANTPAAGLRRATPCRMGFPAPEACGSRAALGDDRRPLPASTISVIPNDPTTDKTMVTPSRLQLPRAGVSPPRTLTTTPTLRFHWPSREAASVAAAFAAQPKAPAPAPSSNSPARAEGEDFRGTPNKVAPGHVQSGEPRRSSTAEPSGSYLQTSIGKAKNPAIASRTAVAASAPENVALSATDAHVVPSPAVPVVAAAAAAAAATILEEDGGRMTGTPIQRSRASLLTKTVGIGRPLCGVGKGTPNSVAMAADGDGDASITPSRNVESSREGSSSGKLNPSVMEVEASREKAVLKLRKFNASDDADGATTPIGWQGPSAAVDKQCGTSLATPSPTKLTPPRYSWQYRAGSALTEQANIRKPFGSPVSAVSGLDGGDGVPLREDSTEPNRARTDTPIGTGLDDSKLRDGDITSKLSVAPSPPPASSIAIRPTDLKNCSRRRSFGFSPSTTSARRTSLVAVAGHNSAADDAGPIPSVVDKLRKTGTAGPEPWSGSASKELDDDTSKTSDGRSKASEEETASQSQEAMPLPKRTPSEASAAVPIDVVATLPCPPVLHKGGAAPREEVDREAFGANHAERPPVGVKCSANPPHPPAPGWPTRGMINIPTTVGCSSSPSENIVLRSHELENSEERSVEISSEPSMEDGSRGLSRAFVQGRDRRRERNQAVTASDDNVEAAGCLEKGVIHGSGVLVSADESASPNQVAAMRRRRDSPASSAASAGESGEGESESGSGSDYETESESGSDPGVDGEGGREGGGHSDCERTVWEDDGFLDDGGYESHGCSGGIVLDPDLPLTSDSSDDASRYSAPSARSSIGEERRSTSITAMPTFSVKAPTKVAKVVETAEIETQTVGGCGNGVIHASVQAGIGRLLTQQELEDDTNIQEMRERLRMMAEDLSLESFHREVVIQEQAQLRRKMTERYEEQIAQLRHRLQEQEIIHKNEKIKMRWDHSNQMEQMEALSGSANGQNEDALRDARAREEDAYREVEELKRSHAVQQASAQETRKALAQLRRKYEEQGAALQKAIRRKEAAQDALRQIMEEREAQNSEEEEEEAEK